MNFNTAKILAALGFDVKPWTMPLEGGPTPMLQCTDKTGLTWYMRADCSVAEALSRYAQKQAQFQSEKQLTK